MRCRASKKLKKEFDKGLALDVAMSNTDAAGPNFSNLLRSQDKVLIGRETVVAWRAAGVRQCDMCLAADWGTVSLVSWSYDKTGIVTGNYQTFPLTLNLQLYRLDLGGCGFFDYCGNDKPKYMFQLSSKSALEKTFEVMARRNGWVGAEQATLAAGWASEPCDALHAAQLVLIMNRRCNHLLCSCWQIV